jgi:hypothetical protein
MDPDWPAAQSGQEDQPVASNAERAFDAERDSSYSDAWNELIEEFSKIFPTVEWEQGGDRGIQAHEPNQDAVLQRWHEIGENERLERERSLGEFDYGSIGDVPEID